MSRIIERGPVLSYTGTDIDTKTDIWWAAKQNKTEQNKTKQSRAGLNKTAHCSCDDTKYSSESK